MTAEVTNAVDRAMKEDDRVSDLVKSVESGELDPYSAAQQIIEHGLVSDALAESRQRDLTQSKSHRCTFPMIATSSPKRSNADAI